MSEIQSLVARVKWLGDSVDKWNAGMISALVIAAIAALFIVLTTRMVVFRSKQLATAEGLLSDAKDRQSAADSKEKDERIADALKQAGESNQAASEANERAGKAQASLASAERQAAEANAKAEGFRLDIAKANEEAARAQAQVAGAAAEAAKANLDLERIRTPRSLTNALGLTDSLKAFKGTEYTILGCFQDQDSINLLVQIDKVLADAGWIRGKQEPTPTIIMNISKDFGVAVTTRSGVYVGAQSNEKIEALQAIPNFMLPEYLQAAMALKGGLASNTSPSQNDLAMPLAVDPGNSTSVFIIVGKKP